MYTYREGFHDLSEFVQKMLGLYGIVALWDDMYRVLEVSNVSVLGTFIPFFTYMNILKNKVLKLKFALKFTLLLTVVSKKYRMKVHHPAEMATVDHNN